jgi:hypothetical protein
MGITTFQIPRDRYGRAEEYSVAFAAAIRQLFQGKSNNIIYVSVTQSSTTTVVTDDRIGVNTVAVCIPQSAAAAAGAMPYRDFTAPVNGSMTLVHTSSGTVKAYKVVLVG